MWTFIVWMRCFGPVPLRMFWLKGEPCSGACRLHKEFLSGLRLQQIHPKSLLLNRLLSLEYLHPPFWLVPMSQVFSPFSLHLSISWQDSCHFGWVHVPDCFSHFLPFSFPVRIAAILYLCQAVKRTIKFLQRMSVGHVSTFFQTNQVFHRFVLILLNLFWTCQTFCIVGIPQRTLMVNCRRLRMSDVVQEGAKVNLSFACWHGVEKSWFGLMDKWYLHLGGRSEVVVFEIVRLVRLCFTCIGFPSWLKCWSREEGPKWEHRRRGGTCW